MKKIITFLFLLLHFLPEGAWGQEADKYWTDEDVLQGIKISDTKEDNIDVLVGENNKTYIIFTAKGLAWIAKVTNGELTKKEEEEATKYYPNEAGFKNCTIELGEINNNKINIEEHYWEPIGNREKSFCGIFNGKNKEIVGLRINEIATEMYNYYGLFGCILESNIENIGVGIKEYNINGENQDYDKSICSGGIIGLTDNGVITNCYVYGEENANIEIISKDYLICLGGIVGDIENNQGITNCYSMIDMNSKGNNTNMIGGIAGFNVSPISNCYSTGNIKLEGSSKENRLGGICGLTKEGSLTNCLSLGKSITIDGGNQKETIATRISSFAGTTTHGNNYASPNFKINEQTVFDDADADGTTIDPKTDLAAVLNKGNDAKNIWIFPGGGGLPYLESFENIEPPTKGLTLNDFLAKPLVLNDDLADDDFIYLRYKENYGWMVTDKGGYEKQVFNGEINGTGIKKGLYISSNVTGENIPTLTISKGLTIKMESSAGIRCYNSVNIELANEAQLDITGQYGLDIYKDATVQLSQSGLNSRNDIGNRIVGSENAGIYNNGELRLNINNLTIKSNSSSYYSLSNLGRIYYQGNSLIIKGGACYFGNNSTTFTISSGTVQMTATGETAIDNSGKINLDENAILEIQTLNNTNPIKNNNGTGKLNLEKGATLLTYKTGEGKPSPHIFTFSKTSDIDITIYDQNNIEIKEGVKIGTGTKLSLKLSDNTLEDKNITFKDAQGNDVDVKRQDESDKLTFTMPNEDLIITVLMRQDEEEPDDEESTDPPYYPTPPAIHYTVTLPSVEGATTNPEPGDYDVESWSSFRFYLTLDSAYNQSQPIVTTDRWETIAPRQSDGAYLIKYVRSDVSISIDGIVKNPDPVANEPVDLQRLSVRCSDGTLIITSPHDCDAAIYTFAGSLLRRLHLTAGDNRVELPAGAYILRADGQQVKVIL